MSVCFPMLCMSAAMIEYMCLFTQNIERRTKCSTNVSIKNKKETVRVTFRPEKRLKIYFHEEKKKRALNYSRETNCVVKTVETAIFAMSFLQDYTTQSSDLIHTCMCPCIHDNITLMYQQNL